MHTNTLLIYNMAQFSLINYKAIRCTYIYRYDRWTMTKSMRFFAPLRDKSTTFTIMDCIHADMNPRSNTCHIPHFLA